MAPSHDRILTWQFCLTKSRRASEPALCSSREKGQATRWVTAPGPLTFEIAVAVAPQVWREALNAPVPLKTGTAILERIVVTPSEARVYAHGLDPLDSVVRLEAGGQAPVSPLTWQPTGAPVATTIHSFIQPLYAHRGAWTLVVQTGRDPISGDCTTSTPVTITRG